jgi:hypothetical protein
LKVAVADLLRERLATLAGTDEGGVDEPDELGGIGVPAVMGTQQSHELETKKKPAPAFFGEQRQRFVGTARRRGVVAPEHEV